LRFVAFPVFAGEALAWRTALVVVRFPARPQTGAPSPRRRAIRYSRRGGFDRRIGAGLRNRCCGRAVAPMPLAFDDFASSRRRQRQRQAPRRAAGWLSGFLGGRA